MLRLKDIVKDYRIGENVTQALKGVSLELRENEFVSILGPSGCGKTTLLNIIGGLDKYTSGDLVINGISTKNYRDRDWDSYRNHRVGFVFQSYNLIPHQNVLANVELALTLSGVSKKERRRRAKEALIKVGLGDQLKKKPNQLSGGQMQRVAIARALVNNPDILLADEPTGALDTETSEQVMDILSEVARDKLVVMVTHNPELAMVYSTRIIRLLDGRIISDSMPVEYEGGNSEASKVRSVASGNTALNSEASGSAVSGTAAFVTDTSTQAASAVAGAAPKYWKESSIAENGGNTENTGISSAASVSETNEAGSNTGLTGTQALTEDVSYEGLSKKQAKKLAKEEARKQKKLDKNRARMEKALLKANRPPRTSMRLYTALGLSMNNLMTKKARTLLTAFAGSIGIIGIALILSLSNGVQEYIDRVEEDTLSSYPVTIEGASIDMTSVMTSFQESASKVEEHEPGRVYTNDIMNSMIKLMIREAKTNNLAQFREFIEDNRERFDELTSDVSYLYSTPLNIYRADVETSVFQVNPQQVFKNLGMNRAGMGGMGMMTTDVFTRLIDNDELLKQQYSVLKGRFPERYDEVVLIVSNNYEATDYTFYALGELDIEELKEMFEKVAAGEEAEPPKSRSYSYDEMLGMRFKLMLNSDYFEKQADGTWADKSDDEVFMINRLKSAPEIKVVGIIRSESDAAMNSLSGMIGYRTDLMEYLINEVNASEIVKDQKEHDDIDVFTGIPFDTGEEKEPLTMEMLQGYIMSLPEEEQAQAMQSIQQMKDYGMDDARILEAFESMMQGASTDATYDGNLSKMGVSDLESPSTINIYPKDFESKDAIMKLVDEYNEGLDEKEQIKVTDYIGLIMSSVTTIINAISYILIAFVAISLVVSSIMIGIITYISVLERTKEIGILRAVGASKKDISRVFNAETLIIGFTAGFLGIVIAELMLIPINAIIYNITDIKNIAVMPPVAAAALVVISMLLTFIAGLFPSRIAAGKDPVVALRTE